MSKQDQARSDRLAAALKTAIAASQVAYDLASRLADRVTPEEAAHLVCLAVGRSEDRPMDDAALRYTVMCGADEYNLPAKYLAQRCLYPEATQ